MRPIRQWTQDHVCLLGDAAHATTPNMGQGACQAIEDAHVLAQCLDGNPVEKAFQMYHTIRLPKAHKIVKSSWSLGKIAHIKNPAGVAIRNFLMQSTPQAMNRKRLENIFQIHE